MTYPDYFKNYRLLTKLERQHPQDQIYKDDLNYFVVQRLTPIVVHFRFLKVHDEKLFSINGSLRPFHAEVKMIFLVAAIHTENIFSDVTHIFTQLCLQAQMQEVHNSSIFTTFSLTK